MKAVLKCPCGDVILRILNHGQQHRFGIDQVILNQQSRDGPQEKRAAAEIFNIEPQALKILGMLPNGHCYTCGHLNARRQQ